MLSESINCLTIKAGFAAMESSRAFWWVKVKGSGRSFMIYETELAKTKNAYNILEMAKTKTSLEVPIHMLELFESEKDSHGPAVRNGLSVHHLRGGNDDLDPLYVSYPDECPHASSSAQAQVQKKVMVSVCVLGGGDRV